ncbi:hypothetical protein PspLS_08162 [Pyricularia sp. CBS 133598]|nr:hypothetical protein PspLS_08162 [Pyricularia sp. CBS 133598]
MKAFNPLLRILPEHGWKRTGIYNILLACTCGLTLVILLFISLSWQEEQSILGTTRIHRGRCKDTARLSIILHLFLNIISTGILASSNFFMQIVTSPSRSEIDDAHEYLRSVDIGLQSLRNLRWLSPFKKICWLFLLLSSLPIHLFFNSAIYQTKYQSQSFNLTIATEAFVNGADYWSPGASLSLSGSSSPVQIAHNHGSRRGYINPESSPVGRRIPMIEGYGVHNPIAQYWKDSSALNETLNGTAANGLSWDVLDARHCMAEYRTSQPRTEYSNLIIIVETGLPEPKGWRRTDVYEFESSSISAEWDAHVPPSEPNSLWSWNHCTVGKDWYEALGRSAQFQTCGRILGLGTEAPDWNKVPEDVNMISFQDNGMKGVTQSNERELGYIPRERTLQISHCLAEPVESCQVRLSNILLLVVIICVLFKIVACAVLMWLLKSTPLVTPGDVVESFISKPDPVTRGFGTLSFHDAQALDYSQRNYYEKLDHVVAFTKPARRWQAGPTRLKSVVSKAIWIQVYYPACVTLSAALTGVIISNTSSPPIEFGPSTNSRGILHVVPREPGYVQILLITNTPQIIFSFCYLAINTLFTQLQVEQEWNLYGQSYKPLRVSYPKGGQISTYRLQLPYKYSVPLIAGSILMHWLISNCLYLTILEGDSGFPQSLHGLNTYLGVSEEAAIAVGFSSQSILITFLCGCIIALSPLIFRRRKLKSQMVLGGTNSLVISAACHVPVPSQRFAPDSDTAIPRDPNPETYLKEVAQGEVRWGAMPLPPDLIQEMEGMELQEGDEPIMHLGFAGPDHVVEEPKNGNLYI